MERKFSNLDICHSPKSKSIEWFKIWLRSERCQTWNDAIRYLRWKSSAISFSRLSRRILFYKLCFRCKSFVKSWLITERHWLNAPCKVIRDSIEFWVPDAGSLILPLWIPEMISANGFQILTSAGFWIPRPNISNSRSKIFQDSGIRLTSDGAMSSYNNLQRVDNTAGVLSSSLRSGCFQISDFMIARPTNEWTTFSNQFKYFLSLLRASRLPKSIDEISRFWLAEGKRKQDNSHFSSAEFTYYILFCIHRYLLYFVKTWRTQIGRNVVDSHLLFNSFVWHLILKRFWVFS